MVLEISFVDISIRSFLSIYAVPAIGASCFAIDFNIVVLPAPLGPIRVSIVPFSIPISISSIRALPS